MPNLTIDHTDSWFLKPSPEIIKISTEDLLVLSVTWHRLRSTNHSTVGVITDMLVDDALISSITTEDRVAASMVRDHFSKKLMMWKLTEVRFSAFMNDLNKFIHSSGKHYVTRDLPLIYRLPEFYEYDLDFGKLKSQFNKVAHTTKMLQFATNSLQPVDYLKRKIKGRVLHEYWLKDAAGRAHMILIEPDNSLQFMWDKEFSKERLIIAGQSLPLVHHDIPYFKVTKWNLVDN